jgi:CRAL/TRIO domain
MAQRTKGRYHSGRFRYTVANCQISPSTQSSASTTLASITRRISLVDQFTLSDLARLMLPSCFKVWLRNEVCPIERITKNHIYEYEKLVRYRLPACSAKAGMHLEKTTTILDLDGVYLSTFSSVFSLIQRVSSIAQNYYPEMLGKMFIVNAPYLFYACWSLVSPLLNEVTVKKISILGINYLKDLQDFIPAQNIPDFLGGPAKENWDKVDIGPWNSGEVPGYPIAEYEKVFCRIINKNDILTC